ncbi:hypothetical protein Tco_0842564 [Tanacetum coccineum]|uniref:Uncharacterized protein n=1 Tax=Tanacetum coccineum TaxID=301880 RepID=A0ABQ5B1T6_9ASTR
MLSNNHQRLHRSLQSRHHHHLIMCLVSSYVADSDLEEDPEEDPADYPADGGDDEEEEEESFEDDDNDEERSGSRETRNAEEDKYIFRPDLLAYCIDHVPLDKGTEPFETDESAATPPPPRSPRIVVPLSSNSLRRERKTFRFQRPLSPATETHIVEYASAPTPPSPSPLPLTLYSSPLPHIPSPPLSVPSPPIPVPSPPLLLPSADRRSDILEVDMPS